MLAPRTQVIQTWSCPWQAPSLEGKAGMQASAEADMGYMVGHGEKEEVGPTLEGQQQLLSSCPES